MNYKLLYLVFTALTLATTANAQLNFSINLNPFNKNFNPVPLRDNIPNAIVKINQTHPTVVVIPRATENQIVLQNSTYASNKVPDSIVKRVLTSPKVSALPPIKILSAPMKKVVFDNAKEPSVNILKPLEPIKPPLIGQDSPVLLPIIDISADEYKMIHALLLLDVQNKLDTAMSLFIDLMNSAKFKLQATFHYAEIAVGFNLLSEFKSKMQQLVKQNENTSIKKKAVESLVKNAHALLVDDVEVLDNEITKLEISTKNSDMYLLKRGKYLSKIGDLERAVITLNQISLNSKVSVEAKLLTATLLYRLGDINSAIKSLEANAPKLSNDKADKFRNLSFLTLARLLFQKGNYKQAYSQYLLIDKSSTFWLQSTTEQALTQILAGDYIGAAGNMFSIHTEYFKKAYSPESYLIRAIGYLNLCQYGDAVSVVADLQRRYTKFNEQITSYKNLNSKAPEYYNLVRELINKPDQSEVSGVPRAFILELARHPSFISIQKKINAYEEELIKFSTVANNLANKASSIKYELNQTNNNISSLRLKKMTDLQIAQLERKVLVLESELSFSIQGKEKIEKMKALASDRINIEKNKLKNLAAIALQAQYNTASKELGEVLEQKDVLAYEIYSGAGEHLRYQMAGGETKERSPASALTPEEKQSYKWKFKGEVWEDEIGHYRSSLSNVCAKEDYAKNSGGK